MSLRTRVLALLGALLIAGAGCQSKLPGSGPSDAVPVAFDKLTPAQAAEKLQFIGGDTFEIRQTLFGMSGYVAELTKAKVGTRQVTINRFAPMNLAEIGWDLTVEEKTQRGLELVSASGTVEHIDLMRTHALLLPVYWTPGPVREFDKSAVWLSDDAYLELSRTGKTVLNFGASDASINELIKSSKDFQSAMNKLRQNFSIESAHKDLTLLEAEKEDVEYTLKVNGKEVKVAAVRAKNWFGEITVLKNRQNPIILKLALNPLTYGAAQVANKEEGLKTVFGFDINNLKIQAVK